jgi:hypothetical protein
MGAYYQTLTYLAHTPWLFLNLTRHTMINVIGAPNIEPFIASTLGPFPIAHKKIIASPTLTAYAIAYPSLPTMAFSLDNKSANGLSDMGAFSKTTSNRPTQALTHRPQSNKQLVWLGPLLR